MMRAALYGDEAVVDHRFAKLKPAFERDPAASMSGAPRARPSGRREALPPGRAHPGRRARPRLNHMTGWYGGTESGGHVGFSPVAPLTGQ